MIRSKILRKIGCFECMRTIFGISIKMQNGKLPPVKTMSEINQVFALPNEIGKLLEAMLKNKVEEVSIKILKK